MTADNTQTNIPVFVASTYIDLIGHRKAVREVLEGLDVEVHGMEDFGAKSTDPLDGCRKDIGCCKIFIGIFSMRYGTFPADHDRSFTHYEYEEAQRLELPTLIYQVDEEHPIPPKYMDRALKGDKLYQFKEQLKDKHTVDYFTTADDLAGKLGEAIKSLLEIEREKEYKQKRNEIQAVLEAAEAELGEAQKELDGVNEKQRIAQEKRNQVKKRLDQAKGELDQLQAPTNYARPDKVERSSYSPGDQFRDGDAFPLMVVIPPGVFMMGSPEMEEGREDNERPMHRVQIVKPFAAGVYPVKFTEWDKCTKAGGCGGYRPTDAGWGRGNRPVISVSWEHAQGYVEWLRAETDEDYRLLSEAEWEYVCRAGTSTPFYYGDTITTKQANYDGTATYGLGSKGRNRQRTMEVGSLEANGFGLYDLHGNVREWVEDCWHSRYDRAPEDGTARKDGACEYRVLRGGSWSNAPKNLRSACRGFGKPEYRDLSTGFRIAKTL